MSRPLVLLLLLLASCTSEGFLLPVDGPHAGHGHEDIPHSEPGEDWISERVPLAEAPVEDGAPFCGDGVVNGPWEQCDGPSDDACPGQCSAHCACPSLEPTGILEIHVVDVGQGDGLVVVSPDGFVLVVDAGPHRVHDPMRSYLLGLDLPSIDYTLVTHLHADHLGGMPSVLETFPETVATFDNGGSYLTQAFGAYDEVAGDRRTPLVTGDVLDLGPSMSATVLYAQREAPLENDNSVVLHLAYGEVTALLGGDCENRCEAELDPGPTRIYKVHHHGSRTSTTDGLLSRMAPEVGLISASATNGYGHPHPETLDTLAAFDVDVWRTDLDGDIVISATETDYGIHALP